MTAHADFDLAGLVRVRVIGDEADIAIVGRQLGLPQSAVAGEPDLTVEFTDHVPGRETFRYLGREEAAFNEDGFFLLRAKGKARAVVRIPFESIGKRPVITCESGLPAVPLLVSLLAVTALHRGLVPLHAGAFSWNGVGVVVTGWSKGGKTETLIATEAAGAQYVGDEWCYIDPARSAVVGIPEPVTLWAWHLRRLPSLRRQIPVATRARMTLLDGPDRIERAIPRRMQDTSAGRLLRRIAYHTRNRANAWIPPGKLFGVTDVQVVGFEHIVLAVSTEDETVVLRDMPAERIATMAAHSVRHELEPLMAAYRMSLFAFPERRSAALDNLYEDLHLAVHRALDSCEGWTLEHPYELDLHRLADALRPLTGASETEPKSWASGA